MANTAAAILTASSLGPSRGLDMSSAARVICDGTTFTVYDQFDLTSADIVNSIGTTAATAVSDMSAAHEALANVPSNFGWAQSPQVSMGCNPTAQGIPGWYSGPKPQDWNKLIVWGWCFREQGQSPTNTRVNVRDLMQAYWSKSRQRWVILQHSRDPLGGKYHTEDQTATAAYSPRQEADGTYSYLPPVGYGCEVYTSQKTFPVGDLGGVFTRISHRLVLDNGGGSDTRATDKWVFQTGGDYWPQDGSGITTNPGVGAGRFQRVTSAWRVATLLVTDGTFDPLVYQPPVGRI